jgi:cell division protein FtsB
MQQINLYQPIFRREKKVFSALAMAQVAGAVLVMLLLAWAWGAWQAGRLTEDVAALKRQRDTQARQLEQLKQRYAVTTPSVALEQEKNRLAQMQAARADALRVLGSSVGGNRQGFSRHLAALARRPVPGVWFSSVQLDGGGARLALKGHALRPQLVPQWMQAIAAETEFAKREFEVFTLSGTAGRVDFELATMGGG